MGCCGAQGWHVDMHVCGHNASMRRMSKHVQLKMRKCVCVLCARVPTCCEICSPMSRGSARRAWL